MSDDEDRSRPEILCRSPKFGVTQRLSVMTKNTEFRVRNDYFSCHECLLVIAATRARIIKPLLWSDGIRPALHGSRRRIARKTPFMISSVVASVVSRSTRTTCFPSDTCFQGCMPAGNVLDKTELVSTFCCLLKSRIIQPCSTPQRQ